MHATPPVPAPASTSAPLRDGRCGLRRRSLAVAIALSLTVVITTTAGAAFQQDWTLARATLRLTLLWLAWRWFGRAVLDRIQQLVEAMSQIAAGDLSVRLHDDRHDELGVAARELNRMAETIATSRDRLEHATAAARDASRAKSEFVANMSHEIRTPMTAILGFADVLRESATDPQQIAAAETIRRNGRYLLDLINDLLDLSKIEAGKLELERIACSPRRMINEVVSLMRLRAEEKGLTLRVRFDGPVPAQIETDPTRLRQILINLVGNAIKFTEAGLVEVVVRTLPADDAHPRPRLRIDVVDTGTGIAPEQMERLFAPFSQGDASVSRRFGGTGLGLTICKRLTEMLGGAIGVESAAGSGSCFTITIGCGSLDNVFMLDDPADSTLVPPAAAAGDSLPRTGLSGRVLVAEDGADNQRLLDHMLRTAGLTVTLVGNGREAVDAALAASAAGQPFDAVLMDIQMPVMDGLAAANELRGRGYAQPLIALTAHAGAAARARCLQAGCDAYVGKPIDRAELLGTVSRFLHRADAAQAAVPSPVG